MKEIEIKKLIENNREEYDDLLNTGHILPPFIGKWGYTKKELKKLGGVKFNKETSDKVSICKVELPYKFLPLISEKETYTLEVHKEYGFIKLVVGYVAESKLDRERKIEELKKYFDKRFDEKLEVNIYKEVAGWQKKKKGLFSCIRIESIKSGVVVYFHSFLSVPWYMKEAEDFVKEEMNSIYLNKRVQ